MKDLVVDFDRGLEKQGLYAILKDLKGKYKIKLAKYSEKRSNKVNAYYRVVLRYISDETGHSEAFLHEVFKEEFIPHVKFEEDFILTTTDMTNEVMWAYIMKIREWAWDFLNVFIPDPLEVIM